MPTEMPAGASEKLTEIKAKLLSCLAHATAEHREASSNFMRYGSAEGGQLLSASPDIEHPYHELFTMYQGMFDQAQSDGVKLREILLVFTRTDASKWQCDERWVTVKEFNEFTSKVKPVVEELRQTLRRLAAERAADWSRISFDALLDKPWRVLLRPADNSRVELQPTGELEAQVARIAVKAEELGLRFTGGEWEVESDQPDKPGEIDSAIGVI